MKNLFLLALLFPAIGFAAPSPPLISAQAPLVLTNNVMSVSQTLPFQVMTLHQQATPANPAATNFKLYFKSDGSLYSLNSSGTETPIGASPALGDLTSGTTGLTVTGGTGAVVGSGTSLTIQTASNSQPGLLSAADHTTFAAKQSALTIGNMTSGTTGVTVGGGTGAIIGSGVTVSVQTASGSQPGLLSAADWTTFNGKQAAGSYITALTSDVSASGPGSVAATVNSVGGSSAANIHSAELLANAATSANTASAIVKRGSSGEFTMGALTAATGSSFAGPATVSGSGGPLANVWVKSDSTTFGLGVLSDGGGAVIPLIGYGATSTRVRGYKAAGTQASPTALSGAVGIIQFEAQGFDGTAYGAGASIQLRGNGTWTTGSHPSDIVMNCAASGGTATAQCLALSTEGVATIAKSGNTTANVLNGPLVMTGSSGINLYWATDLAGNIGTTDGGTTPLRPGIIWAGTAIAVGGTSFDPTHYLLNAVGSESNYMLFRAQNTSVTGGMGMQSDSVNASGGIFSTGPSRSTSGLQGPDQVHFYVQSGSTGGVFHFTDPAVDECFTNGGRTASDRTFCTKYSAGGNYVKFDRAAQFTGITSTTRDSLTAAVGMMIYNSTVGQFQGYDGTWRSLATLTGTETLSAKTLSSATVTGTLNFGNFNIAPSVNPLGTISGSNSVSLANVNLVTMTLSGATTISALTSPQQNATYRFLITENGTGGYAVTWPATVTKWINPGKVAPTAGGANNLLVVDLTCIDGTNFWGTSSQDY